MKQLFHTACPGGKRLDSQASSGFGIRAASPGTSDKDWKPLMPFLGCEFPRVAPPGALARLSFLEVGGRRVLFHSVPGGVDEHNRPVTHFTQALLDVPADCGLLACVRTWGSPGWHRPPYTDGTELPEYDGLPAGTTLHEGGLPAYLGNGRAAEMVEFVLSALLTGSTAQVLLGAEPEAVAWCLFAVGLALPPALLGGVTFSTLEPTPSRSGPARIVGIWADGKDVLGPFYRQPTKLCFHLDSGSRSPALPTHAYASFAVRELAEGRADRLAAFVATCVACDVRTIEQLTDLQALEYRPQELDAATVARLLREPAPARRFCEQPSALDRVVGWAIAGEAGGRDSLAAMVRLRQGDSPFRDALVQRLVEPALKAAQKGDAPLLRRIRDDLLPAVDAEAVFALGREAWGRLAPEQMRREVRQALLPLVAAVADPNDSSRIGAWVSVPADEFAALLRLKLPQPWVVQAWARRLASGPVHDADAIAHLVSHAETLGQVVEALEPLLESAELNRRLDSILNRTPLEGLLDRFEQRGTLPAFLCERILDAHHLARVHLRRPAVLALLARDPARQQRLIEWAIEHGEWDHLGGSVLHLLDPARVIDQVGRVSVTALRQHRGEERARRGLEEWLQQLAGTEYRTHLELALSEVAPRDLSPAAAEYVLGLAGRHQLTGLFQSWLRAGNLNQAQLARLLDLTADADVLFPAARAYYGLTHDWPAGVGRLAAHPERLVALIGDLGEPHARNCAALVRTLTQQSYPEKLVGLLLEGAATRPEVFWPTLDPVVEHLTSYARAEQQWDLLVETARTLGQGRVAACGRVPFSPALEGLCRALLQMPAERKRDPAVRQFFQAVQQVPVASGHRPGPSEDLLDDLASECGGDLGNPEVMRKAIDKVKTKPADKQSAERQRLLKTIAKQLLECPPERNPPQWLHGVVEALRKGLNIKRAYLLAEVYKVVAAEPSFWQSRWHLAAVVYVAVRLASESQDRNTEAEEIVRVVVQGVMKRTPRLLHHIDRCANDWDDALFDRWCGLRDHFRNAPPREADRMQAARTAGQQQRQQQQVEEVEPVEEKEQEPPRKKSGGWLGWLTGGGSS